MDSFEHGALAHYMPFEVLTFSLCVCNSITVASTNGNVLGPPVARSAPHRTAPATPTPLRDRLIARF
jgi:hypothetical protein